jgi:pimeloyl-ACP methyl ester carboxylesterase
MSDENRSNEHGDRIPETLGRRKAIFFGSLGIAGAFLTRTKVAAQAFDKALGDRITGRAKKINVNGLNIEYEIIGEGNPVVITPGGRFAKETPGVRELAEALARGGKKVLIWDRPNCGGSDMSFDAPTESLLHANTLAGLLRVLKMVPAMLVGGSGGSRVSLLAAEHHPDVVSKLFILWISGGNIGLASLVMVYDAPSMNAANRGGMEAVTALPDWAECIRRNPRNREYILKQDPERFIETMQRWGGSFFPTSGSPVPGMTPESFRKIKAPTMVLRSGKSDLSHTRKTSEDVAAMIPGAIIAEPPWGDKEWNSRNSPTAEGLKGLFGNWPKLAPQILDFAKKA